MIIPTILIVYVGLLSVFLSADDHTGDRAALLSVSILICMINLERDHGLGKLSAPPCTLACHLRPLACYEQRVTRVGKRAGKVRPASERLSVRSRRESGLKRAIALYVF